MTMTAATDMSHAEFTANAPFLPLPYRRSGPGRTSRADEAREEHWKTRFRFASIPPPRSDMSDASWFAALLDQATDAHFAYWTQLRMGANTLTSPLPSPLSIDILPSGGGPLSTVTRAAAAAAAAGPQWTEPLSKRLLEAVSMHHHHGGGVVDWFGVARHVGKPGFDAVACEAHYASFHECDEDVVVDEDEEVSPRGGSKRKFADGDSDFKEEKVDDDDDEKGAPAGKYALVSHGVVHSTVHAVVDGRTHPVRVVYVEATHQWALPVLDLRPLVSSWGESPPSTCVGAWKRPTEAITLIITAKLPQVHFTPAGYQRFLEEKLEPDAARQLREQLSLPPHPEPLPRLLPLPGDDAYDAPMLPAAPLLPVLPESMRVPVTPTGVDIDGDPAPVTPPRAAAAAASSPMKRIKLDGGALVMPGAIQDAGALKREVDKSRADYSAMLEQIVKAQNHFRDHAFDHFDDDVAEAVAATYVVEFDASTTCARAVDKVFRLLADRNMKPARTSDCIAFSLE
jgi:hypothetical protein